MHLANKAAKAQLGALSGQKKKRVTRVQQSINDATSDYQGLERAFQHRGEGIYKAAIDAQEKAEQQKSRRVYSHTPRGPPKSNVDAGIAGMATRAAAVPRGAGPVHALPKVEPIFSRKMNKSNRPAAPQAQAQSAVPSGMPAGGVPSDSEKALKDPAFKDGKDPLFKAPLKDPAFDKRKIAVKALVKAMTPAQSESSINRNRPQGDGASFQAQNCHGRSQGPRG